MYNKLERGEQIDEEPERIRQYVSVIKLVPIDQPIQHDGGTARLLDTLVDASQEDQQEEGELGIALIELLSNLDSATEKYICLKFGTFSHLHKKIDFPTIDVLRERIRQTLALMKFHHPS